MKSEDVPRAAARITDAIENDIAQRRGLRHEWEQIAPEIQQEIRDKWRLLIARAIVEVSNG